MRSHSLLLILLPILLIAACTTNEEPPAILVSLVVDGRERTFEYDTPVTVGEFLRDPKVAVELGPQDDISHPLFTQITDGMRITIVRVTETEECNDNVEIPYHQRSMLNEGLEPGQEILAQAGETGVEQVCYRITRRDGVPGDPVEISRTVIRESKDEIIYIGPTVELEPVAITGTLAYISNGNAWVMRGSSTSKRNVTESSDLDQHVFSLSSDGRQLLFTRRTSGEDQETFFNRLWLLPNVHEISEPVRLTPENVLYADWIPAQENTISYSTGEPRETAPRWKALNNLWTMRIDPSTGASLNVEELVEESFGGLYGWWGTRFQWSPDGEHVAWVRADSVGLVDLDTASFNPLLNYAVFQPVGDWSWRATVSWSPDSALLVTTVHGPPVGREQPDTSPAFNIAVTNTEGSFSTEVLQGAGIWASPSYSPLIADPDSEYPQGYLAYLRARDPYNSINGEYDLIVADRDGSNAHIIFPSQGDRGITAQESIRQNREFAWSPDGRQIALIYQGNLWIVDVESSVFHRLTQDGGASNPVWTR